MANYPLIPGTLASDCWPASPQTFYNEMFAKGYVQLSIVGVVISATVPAVADRNKLWAKVDGGAQPTGYFIYAGGLWLQPHPVPASSSVRQLWVGAEADLVTYDGGVAGVVSAASGPFWEVDHDFDARFPVGPGTTAGGTIIGVGDTGGEDAHTLTVAELPAHTHPPLVGTQYAMDNDGGTGAGTNASTADGLTEADTTGATGDGDPHNTLPPYRGAFVIKRTARIFYVG